MTDPDNPKKADDSIMAAKAHPAARGWTDTDDATIEEARKEFAEGLGGSFVLPLCDIATRRGEEIKHLKGVVTGNVEQIRELLAQSADGKCAVPNHPNWSPAQITTINYEETCQYADSLKSERDALAEENEHLRRAARVADSGQITTEQALALAGLNKVEAEKQHARITALAEENRKLQDRIVELERKVG